MLPRFIDSLQASQGTAQMHRTLRDLAPEAYPEEDLAPFLAERAVQNLTDWESTKRQWLIHSSGEVGKRLLRIALQVAGVKKGFLLSMAGGIGDEVLSSAVSCEGRTERDNARQYFFELREGLYAQVMIGAAHLLFGRMFSQSRLLQTLMMGAVSIAAENFSELTGSETKATEWSIASYLTRLVDMGTMQARSRGFEKLGLSADHHGKRFEQFAVAGIVLMKPRSPMGYGWASRQHAETGWSLYHLIGEDWPRPGKRDESFEGFVRRFAGVGGQQEFHFCLAHVFSTTVLMKIWAGQDSRIKSTELADLVEREPALSVKVWDHVLRKIPGWNRPDWDPKTAVRVVVGSDLNMVHDDLDRKARQYRIRFLRLDLMATSVDAMFKTCEGTETEQFTRDSIVKALSAQLANETLHMMIMETHKLCITDEYAAYHLNPDFKQIATRLAVSLREVCDSAWTKPEIREESRRIEERLVDIALQGKMADEVPVGLIDKLRETSPEAISLVMYRLLTGEDQMQRKIAEIERHLMAVSILERLDEEMDKQAFWGLPNPADRAMKRFLCAAQLTAALIDLKIRALSQQADSMSDRVQTLALLAGITPLTKKMERYLEAATQHADLRSWRRNISKNPGNIRLQVVLPLDRALRIFEVRRSATPKGTIDHELSDTAVEAVLQCRYQVARFTGL